VILALAKTTETCYVLRTEENTNCYSYTWHYQVPNSCLCLNPKLPGNLKVLQSSSVFALWEI